MQNSNEYPIKIIDLKDPNYPQLLKQIYDPPSTLYYRGNNLPASERKSIAIVGSRKPTPYGLECVKYITFHLQGLNVNIISGLALGIDSAAHKSALDLKIPTYAVLGSSLDDNNIYPRFNNKLALEIICHGGSLISEFPSPTPPYKMNFPKRNRIIAGLCDIVIVVEAAEKSGALITAEFAMDQGRDIYAVPGSIFSKLSVGPNQLISKGATPLTDLRQFVADNFEGQQQKLNFPTPNLSEIENQVLNIVHHTPISFEQLLDKTCMTPAQLNPILMSLELKNLINILPNQTYQKSGLLFDKT
jgi:DNA processing protein